MRIFQKKFILSEPSHFNIVIFNEMHSERIVKYILKEYDYFIYNMNPEIIYISLKSILYTLLSIKYLKIKNIKYNIFKALLSALFSCYRIALLRIIKPKIVITMIDNSKVFHDLSNHYEGAEFFTIQNALRVNYDLKKDIKFCISHYFCFGKYSVDMMRKYNHIIKNNYPIGSFKLGIADTILRKNSDTTYDLGIVSQYRLQEQEGEEYFNKTTCVELKEKHLVYRKFHNQIHRYCLESGCKMSVIMSSAFESDAIKEIEYYKDIYGENVTLLSRDEDKLGSFAALYRCKVIVAFFSSLSIEAFGIGKKILRIDYTNSNNWNEYDPMILLSNPSYNDLRERLNNLLSEPYEEYRERTNEYAKYLMNYNPDCPPHEFVRSKIEEYLKV